MKKYTVHMAVDGRIDLTVELHADVGPRKGSMIVVNAYNFQEKRP